ncbi:MAG: SRPBCC domain-containing protein [Desulfobacterales bacterium]
MRPPKRERPVIAILALNEATEVADLLVAYGVLRQGKIAEVNVVAERAEPIQLYPGDLSIEPQTTARSHSFGGTYLKLVPGELLVYTDVFDDPNLPGEMKVTVRLKEVSAYGPSVIYRFLLLGFEEVARLRRLTADTVLFFNSICFTRKYSLFSGGFRIRTNRSEWMTALVYP